MYSMTGYGKADYRDKTRAIGIEVSSVNNRYLEFLVRIPRELSVLEPMIKEAVGESINRGKVTVCIHYEDFGSGVQKVLLNKALAGDIYKQLKELKKKYKLIGDIDINHFLAFPDIFTISKDARLPETVWPHVKTALDRAMKEMISMRRKEGLNLKKDLGARLKILSQQIAKIEKLTVKNKSQYKKKLAKRIADIVEKKQIDNSRLEEEIAYLVDRADVTEESVRFKSHIKQFQGALTQREPVGKRLNFILQELNREANTIGSKASDTDVAAIVVSLKEVIEKMREQVQNIE